MRYRRITIIYNKQTYIMKASIKTTTTDNRPMIIDIRLSDPCKNGHNDFAITGTIYRKGTKVLLDRYFESCGCIHEDILKKHKSLQIFVDLHLSDENGVPMYALENGYYHLQGVQGVAAHGHTCTLENFAKYMRIDFVHAQNIVNTLKTKAEFVEFVNSLKPQWKQEAEQAKELLELIIQEKK